MMKRMMMFSVAAILSLAMFAQPGYYRGSRGPRGSKVVVVRQPHAGTVHVGHDSYYGWRHTYYGLRVGLNASSVRSEAHALDGHSVKTGLNIGAVVGTQLSYYTPIYLEGGLYYSQKGGKSDNVGGDKFTYDLNYLELPVVLKYRHFTTSGVSIEPFAGGYLACGVAGDIKNYGARQAYSSYSDGNFSRFDGGLRIGCGVGYGMGYAEVAYDLGLANVGQSDFDNTHNGCFTVSVGVNF